jgi:hypothetical protein
MKVKVVAGEMAAGKDDQDAEALKDAKDVEVAQSELILPWERLAQLKSTLAWGRIKVLE